MNADGTQDKTYIVQFKVPAIMVQTVKAVRAEMQGDHLVFIDSQGRLAGLFLMELVESWSEL